tara:strand:+ start:324 stop:617 length:294 start_codon:yes stop_codon:yes gene_type:complete
MLVRKCAKGHKIYIFKSRATGPANISIRFSDSETVSFDTQGKSYIVTNDGAVAKRTDSWLTAQSSYDTECKKEHSDTIGALKVGKHKLVNGVATSLT